MTNYHHPSLIVDFPAKPRKTDSTTIPRSSVSFHREAEVKLYEVDANERSSKAYQKQDYKSFQIEAIRDRQRAARLIHQGVAPEDLTEDQRCKLADTLLSSGISKRSVEHRRKHTNLITSKQHLHSGVELSVISQASSASARRAAQRLAAFAIQADLEDDEAGGFRQTSATKTNIGSSTAKQADEKEEPRSEFDLQKGKRRQNASRRMTGKGGRKFL